MKYKIIEVDRDYHGHLVNTFFMYFSSLEEAREWCRTNAPLGSEYIVDSTWTEGMPQKSHGVYRVTIIDQFMKNGKI